MSRTKIVNSITFFSFNFIASKSCLIIERTKEVLLVDKETVKVCIVVVGKVVTTLIVAEALAGAVSRPIAAWRARPNGNVEALNILVVDINERLCKLEEKEEA